MPFWFSIKPHHQPYKGALLDLIQSFYPSDEEPQVLQKQITLKDMALKRAENEKGKIVAEHTKTLQNVERKQDLTLKMCENIRLPLLSSFFPYCL
jgi:hypothetical protein